MAVKINDNISKIQQLSGSCRTFLPQNACKTRFWGSPSRSATRSGSILLNQTNILRHLTERNKIILSSLGIILFTSAVMLSGLVNMSFTSALEYQFSSDVQFTFNPTLSLTLSGDLRIEGLAPGSFKDSNVIDISVSTNHVSGYTLSATTGNNTDPTTNLTHNDNNSISSNGYQFTPLPSDAASSSDFPPNTWGYSYSLDSGTTWSSYSNLPLYTTTATTLLDTTSPATNTIKFKIGAKASSTQAAGTYANVVNFTATANPAPTTFDDAFAAAGKTKYNGYFKMQDMTSTICDAVDIDSNMQLVDVRDDEIYMIAKLKDGNCWMLDNLRLGDNQPITLTNQDTNMAAESWELPGSVSSGYDSLNTPKINSEHEQDTTAYYGVGSGKVGVYYNYCAASAGTVCAFYTNSGEIVYENLEHDICASGWRIPTGGANGEYDQLLALYPAQSASNTGSFQYNFSAVLSGYYLRNQSYQLSYVGHWWSASYRNDNKASRLYASMDDAGARGSQPTNDGFSLRCLAK